MKRIPLLAVFAIFASLLSSCGSGETYWQEASKAVEEYLSHIKAGNYAKAHELHDIAHPTYGESAKGSDFETAMKQQAELWPGLFNFNWELERRDGSTRTRVYYFKVNLTWPNGNPADRGNEHVTPSGEKFLPVIGPTMSASVTQRHGSWKVRWFAIYNEPMDLFGSK
jgi:hypothetical protein